MDVDKAAARWRADTARADASRAALIAAVRAAHDAGASEYTLAKAAGVARMTIRTWLGKS